MKITLGVIGLLWFGNAALAQEHLGELVPQNFDQGSLVIDQEDEEDPGLAPAVDLFEFMPPALDQKNRKVCWAFASSNLLSFMANAEKKSGYFYDKTGNPLRHRIRSPELAIQRHFGSNDCDKGAYTAELLAMCLNTFGSVPLALLDYSAECNQGLEDEVLRFARVNVQGVYEVQTIYHTSLIEMKRVLASGQPLIISIAVDNNFAKIDSNVTEKYEPRWSSFGRFKADHAMTIIGYNDSIASVRVLNSSGVNWGNRGTVWISYDILYNHAKYYCYAKLRKDDQAVKRTEPEKEAQKMTQTSLTAGEISSWAKPGYYREFDNTRVGIALANPKEKFALFEIRDESSQQLISFYVDEGSSKTYLANGNAYELKYEKHANVSFLIGDGVFFTVRKIDPTSIMTNVSK